MKKSHGLSQHELYHTWCDRWKNSVQNFISDMGSRPFAHMLERKNNKGNYSPDNCIWATCRQQQNNRSGNVEYEFSGLIMTLADWASCLGLPCITLWHRVKIHGWSLEKAFTTTVRKWGAS